MRAENVGGEQGTRAASALQDPLSHRILEVVDHAEDVHHGRGPNLDQIADAVLQGPIWRRAAHGSAGVESRVHELVGREYLRLDGWGNYHVTARGWVEGLERPLEQFSLRT